MWLNTAEVETPNLAHLQLQQKILNSASHKFLKLCGFRNVALVNIVHYYIANCRTVKMAIICINQTKVYLCHELLKEAWILLCVYFASIQRHFPITVWSCANKYVLSLGGTENEEEHVFCRLHGKESVSKKHLNI